MPRVGPLVSVLVSGVVLALVALRCGTQAIDVVIVPLAPSFAAHASLANLERRLHDGEHERMRAIFPEGGLVSLAFTGFALVNDAVLHPDDVARREHARDEVLWILAQTDRERDVAPFSSWGGHGKAPWRGVILEGQQNLLRAGYVELGGDDVDVVRAYHATSQRLFDMFMRAPSGALESFSHRTWYVDNVTALESLRLHDVIYGTHYAPAVAHFSAKLRSHIDSRSGMPASEVSLDDTTALDGPRGCALSWSLAFLPALDPALSKELYARYRKDWSVDVFGMIGFREYPPWRHGKIDVDSGPIVHDIGGAASAFGVAAARANDDGETLARMLTALEMTTLPATTLHGDEELFAGQLILADALSTWARTVTPWDKPHAPPRLLASLRFTFWPVLCALLLLLTPVVVSVVVFVRAVRSMTGPINRTLS